MMIGLLAALFAYLCVICGSAGTVTFDEVGLLRTMAIWQAALR
jgi:hypothetical protein